ncbi:hypothetical protein [Isoptericola dokdonensis]|uniref:Uncharacterized protein n=1 Tax=Isoptericola dokdonensis DS-3 TaxID=1300344 RepID=A0A161IEX8_9MICO|nr:hypothetical protein [Isoptericola dokdonensis]ANC29934.1 hypothetical protein I598_0346 [Isoptericola dokdonensis DS-3]
MNDEKMSGFYVDADYEAEDVHGPADAGDDGLVDLIVDTARIAEMLLVRDHSRMKFADPAVPYDGTHGLQVRFLDYSGAFADEGDDE